MARWLWPTAAGVVTSATGVLVNLATNQVDNPWTWAGVVLLTAAGIVVALTARRAEARPEEHRPSVAVHNSVTGNVYGGLIQAGALGSVDLDHGRAVDQSARADDHSTIIQAGRDVRHDRRR